MNEVALSTQFEGDIVDEVATLGTYRPAVKDAFPNIEKQPALPPLAEDFSHPPTPGPPFQFIQGPPSTRYWFVSEDGTSLIQVQGDRFGFNWRRIRGEESYPRYRRYVRPTFERWYRAFKEVAEAERESPLAPTWCEITYINHVDAQGAAPATHGPLSRIMRALQPESVSEALPEVEDTQLHQRFLVLGEDEEPVARLYLSATPAFRALDGAPIYVVLLLVRGRPPTPSVEGVLSFFDLGRDLIVRGFKESTTEEMHRLWGLEDSDG